MDESAHERAVEAARVAWLEKASDYTLLDKSIAAAIAAYLAVMEREGWKMVPVVPTEAMMLAFNDAEVFHGDSMFKDEYQKMLAAAPSPHDKEGEQ